MGGFYGNITIKGPSQQMVAQALSNRRALVTPKIGDCTVVFDSVCVEQDVDGIQALSLALSNTLSSPVLALLVLDDDVLIFFLFNEGKLTDSYNSFPHYFDSAALRKSGGPAGGDATKLCHLFGVDSRSELENVLRKPHGKGGYVFETERHRDLTRLLALPALAVGKALASFDRGEYPEGLSERQMMRAANPPPVEDRKQKQDRKFYEQLGPEDPMRPCNHVGCSRGAVRLSIMCKRHHYEMIMKRDCPFDH